MMFSLIDQCLTRQRRVISAGFALSHSRHGSDEVPNRTQSVVLSGQVYTFVRTVYNVHVRL